MSWFYIKGSIQFGDFIAVFNLLAFDRSALDLYLSKQQSVM